MTGDNESLVLGIDFGTDSVRTVVFSNKGETVASCVEQYPRWQQGLYCDPARNQYRQHPRDYLDSLEKAINQTVTELSSVRTECIKGIAIDTTGSTPVAVNRNGIPLSLMPDFESNANAMFILWKDHTAIREADDINRVAHAGEHPDYTRYSGRTYSSEWFWAKMLHVLRSDAAVREAAFSWVEHCDWITGELVGICDPLILKRSRCAAGHKAMWHAEFGGLPPDAFWIDVDPLLGGMRDRLYTETHTCDSVAGLLTQEWAERLGLPGGTPVAVGAFDAHVGAIGAGIGPGSLVKVMGTSTCDMLVAPTDEFVGEKLISGICGQVDGSIIPGMVGMEAGQSAFGDVYAWFRDLLMWPIANLVDDTELQQAIAVKLLTELSDRAQMLTNDGDTLLALDWFNGRRTPDADPTVKGALTGLTLGTDAPRVFKALVEATAFGSRAIVDRFVAEGVQIDNVVAVGGVADRSPLVMQILANVLDKSINLSAVEQTCALGAAMSAAVAGGLYEKIEDAQSAMGGGFRRTYKPDKASVEHYKLGFENYLALASQSESRAS